MATIETGEFLGHPALLLRTPLMHAALSLHGGQLLSFVPKGFDDLLWLSPVSRRAPDAIRGGVPVCWPYFGRQGQPADAPQHGFARNLAWTLVGASRAADGETTLELSLPARAETPLRLSQVLRIGRDLTQSVTTRNTGDVPVAFTQALHTYFRVGDAQRVQVEGLDQLAYADKYDNREHLQAGAWDLHNPRDPGRSDRIYHRAGGRYTLHDPVLERRIELATSGSRSLVVWNPGEQGIAAIGDAPADGWRHFVCLEAANAGEDLIELAPGEDHTLQQTLGVAAVEGTSVAMKDPGAPYRG
jgi:glucose-6-phosphate 1-epimerase